MMSEQLADTLAAFESVEVFLSSRKIDDKTQEVYCHEAVLRGLLEKRCLFYLYSILA